MNGNVRRTNTGPSGTALREPILIYRLGSLGDTVRLLRDADAVLSMRWHVRWSR